MFLYRERRRHGHSLRIYPFGDGNGRTGHILLNAMLEKCGYPPVALKAKRARDYFAALERAQADDDPRDFIKKLANNVSEELDARIRTVESAGCGKGTALRSFLFYLSSSAEGGKNASPPRGPMSHCWTPSKQHQSRCAKGNGMRCAAATKTP